MQPPRQVPKIGHQRPIISQDTLPPIQSPLAMLGSEQQQPQQLETASGDAMQDLALEIYARLAVKHIEHNQQTDRETLQTLAMAAQTAARVYFEGGEQHG